MNHGLGNRGWCVPPSHAYRGAAIATIATLRHALAAGRQGCDAMQSVGHEAAGRGGEIGSLVSVPTPVAALSIPVVAGGLADGRGLAPALGAQAAALGTRFTTVGEKPATSEHKSGGDRGRRRGHADYGPSRRNAVPRAVRGRGAPHGVRRQRHLRRARRLAPRRARARRVVARAGRRGCGSDAAHARSARPRARRGAGRTGSGARARGRRHRSRAAGREQRRAVLGKTPKLSLSLRRGSAPRKCGSRRRSG